MGAKQRRKGANGELEAIEKIKEYWLIDTAYRTATAQASYRTNPPDLGGVHGLHLEVKRHASVAACRFLDQAIKDAKVFDDTNLPVVLGREDRGQWFCLMRMEDVPLVGHAILFQRKGDDDEKGT